MNAFDRVRVVFYMMPVLMQVFICLSLLNQSLVIYFVLFLSGFSIIEAYIYSDGDHINHN
ncbi:hypothetical protein UA38_05555 [Photobacterium kishitanii]|uniref:Uncharacterized protein n=1 Tax=Photobacterium kishitanii TaxID=318456 RepID=A0AAX0Z1Z7_9GAMM|nr:hypothetical protein UA38_05555 [Photobacterium kishitanii]KJG62752.1 hypothetical protein UA42_04475 [Photobacterium kishitanii]KJG66651.1 hypothetical protein UA40_06365 [Photobacterium kishitanii]KJG70994.1 hypothetical protein UA41_04110 [Photobacterium kishitanii]PSX21396.1 hypothetical protein C0W70_03960 [Photobacterium kishitanii]